MTTLARSLARVDSGVVRWPACRSSVGSYAAVAAVALVLWGYIVSPMLLTLRRSMEGGALQAYRPFGSGVVAESLLWSIGISLLSVIAAGVVGTTLAVLLQRWDFPLRNVFHMLVLTPLALPPFMGVAAFVRLYGLGGFVPALLGTLFHADPNAFAIRGITGVLLVHAVSMHVYFYLPVSVALQHADDSLEEAAQSLGASVRDTWRRVLLPMMRPAIVSGSLLTFMSSMGSYTAPWLFGVNSVLTRQIAIAYEEDMRFASAASVVLALFSLVFLVTFRAYERRAVYWTQSKGGARRRRQTPTPRCQAGLFSVACLSSAFMMLPTAMIVVLAFSVDGSWRQGLLPAQFGLQNLIGLIRSPGWWTPIANSLQMSAIAATGATAIGLCCAYVVGRMRVQGKTALETAMMLPWALPGTVVAFNLIVAFNRPSTLAFGYTLVGTYAILPLAYIVRFSPLVFRSTAASLSQLDPHVEEAARSLGAGSWSAFRRGVLPLLAPGISAGALLVFAGGIGEYVATSLLHRQESYKPLSIAIAEHFYQGNVGSAAAWGTVQILLVLTVLLMTRRMENRNRSWGSF